MAMIDDVALINLLVATISKSPSVFSLFLSLCITFWFRLILGAQYLVAVAFLKINGI